MPFLLTLKRTNLSCRYKFFPVIMMRGLVYRRKILFCSKLVRKIVGNLPDVLISLMQVLSAINFSVHEHQLLSSYVIHFSNLQWSRCWKDQKQVNQKKTCWSFRDSFWQRRHDHQQVLWPKQEINGSQVLQVVWSLPMSPREMLYNLKVSICMSVFGIHIISSIYWFSLYWSFLISLLSFVSDTC